MLLFGLLLWQNPVLAVEEWIMGGFGDGDFRWARLARDLCQFTGMQVGLSRARSLVFVFALLFFLEIGTVTFFEIKDRVVKM